MIIEAAQSLIESLRAQLKTAEDKLKKTTGQITDVEELESAFFEERQAFNKWHDDYLDTINRLQANFSDTVAAQILARKLKEALDGRDYQEADEAAGNYLTKARNKLSALEETAKKLNKTIEKLNKRIKEGLQNLAELLKGGE